MSQFPIKFRIPPPQISLPGNIEHNLGHLGFKGLKWVLRVLTSVSELGDMISEFFDLKLAYPEIFTFI